MKLESGAKVSSELTMEFILSISLSNFSACPGGGPRHELTPVLL